MQLGVELGLATAQYNFCSKSWHIEVHFFLGAHYGLEVECMKFQADDIFTDIFKQ